MSEQWWALEDKTAGPFAAFKYLEAANDEADFHRHEHGMEIEIVPVRIVEDAGPCEWEKSFCEPGSWKVFRAGPHYKDEMEEDFSMTPKYCPNCGRLL